MKTNKNLHPGDLVKLNTKHWHSFDPCDSFGGFPHVQRNFIMFGCNATRTKSSIKVNYDDLGLVKERLLDHYVIVSFVIDDIVVSTVGLTLVQKLQVL